MQAVDPNRRFARTRGEAILAILSILTAIYVVSWYGTYDSFVIPGLMILAISMVLGMNESIDRRRWIMVAGSIAAIWVICNPVHALFIALVD
jgi:hypothetical protein